MRRIGFGRSAPEPLFLFGTDAPLKAHPDYRAAKAGDVEAAVRLVGDLAGPLVPRVRTQCPTGALYAAPHAIEASGDNAIPQVLAAALAEASGGRLDEEIIQANRVYHTGADPMERLIARAEFDGAVEGGADYVLVDDVTTMAGRWPTWRTTSRAEVAASPAWWYWSAPAGQAGSFRSPG